LVPKRLCLVVSSRSVRRQPVAFCVTPRPPPSAAGQQGIAEQYYSTEGNRELCLRQASRVTLTYDHLTPKIDRFMLLPR